MLNILDDVFFKSVYNNSSSQFVVAPTSTFRILLCYITPIYERDLKATSQYQSHYDQLHFEHVLEQNKLPAEK